eukprot:CAMPEP_0174740842 /NCGR_PEP_ID=MMETSP1094-20130205/74624_1 /TAXON_ID=156173 /ORGANISM="Chrysochromulina brevifilum, Strain UTEX LB 985" /LENGTH=109 /DNA_ID=CAMNT_0015944621 /DNA_START=267 /DNA_END=592 /DNA_ORIENTATION=-
MPPTGSAIGVLLLKLSRPSLIIFVCVRLKLGLEGSEGAGSMLISPSDKRGDLDGANPSAQLCLWLTGKESGSNVQHLGAWSGSVAACTSCDAPGCDADADADDDTDADA